MALFDDIMMGAWPAQQAGIVPSQTQFQGYQPGGFGATPQVVPQMPQAAPGSVSQQAGGLTMPNHSLTSLLGIGGKAKGILDWLGDTILTAGGLHNPYAGQAEQRAQATALQGYEDNPQLAVQKYLNAGGNPQVAGEMQMRPLQVAEAKQKYEGSVLDSSLAALQPAVGHPEQWSTIRAMLQKNADNKGVDISMIPQAYPTKTVDGKEVPDDDAAQKVIYSRTPGYKVVAAEANAQRANEGQQRINDLAKWREFLGPLLTQEAGYKGEAAHAQGVRAGVDVGIHTDPTTGRLIPVTDPRLHPQSLIQTLLGGGTGGGGGAGLPTRPPKGPNDTQQAGGKTWKAVSNGRGGYGWQ